jgi:hypothetical protein
MRIFGAAMFLPEWFTAWILVAAIAAGILGFRRVAGILALIPMIDWVLVPLAAPFVDALPAWLVVTLLLISVLMLVQGVLTMLFGREASGHVIGTFIVRFIDLFFGAPVAIARILHRTFF